MSVRAWIATLLFALAGHAAPAAAVCPSSVACAGDGSNDAVKLQGCCGATSCDLDRQITFTGPMCVLEFGTKRVIVSSNGRLLVRTPDLEMIAASVEVAGIIDAHDAAGTAGGRVSITTIGGAVAPARAIAMTRAESTIDVSGSGIFGGGAIELVGDGPVDLANGKLLADGTGPTSSGGSITIRSTQRSAMQIAARLSASGSILGAGGSVIVRAADTLLITKVITVLGDDRSTIDVLAGGSLTVERDARLSASAQPGSEAAGGGDGGEVSLDASTVTLKGPIEAAADGDSTAGTVTVQARNGPITLSGDGINVDGDAGQISLVTVTAAPGTGPVTATGDIVVGAPLSGTATGSALGGTGGGSVQIDAKGSVTLTKLITVSGLGGEGGDVDVVALRDVVLADTGGITGNDESGGGSFTVTAGHDVRLLADVVLRGTTGDLASGGDVAVFAGNDLQVGPVDVDVTGVTGDGGTISLIATANLTVAKQANLVADSGDTVIGRGGAVALRAGTRCPSRICGSDRRADAAGSVTLAGRIAPATATATGPSLVELDGCNVTVAGAGLVDANGGATIVRARQGVTFQKDRDGTGQLLTRGAGTNTLVFVGTTPPVTVPAGPSPISPAFATQPTVACPGQPQAGQPACLWACPSCGDGSTIVPCGQTGCSGSTGPFCDHCQQRPCADDGNACTVEACDAAGGCFSARLAEGTECGRVGQCPKLCDGGTVERPPACSFARQVECDDHNPCTRDCFDPATGCVHDPLPAAETPRRRTSPSAFCDDDNPCNGVETCGAGGQCEGGTPVACAAGTVCDPGRPSSDPCRAAPCTPATVQRDCDDGNPCTVATCIGGSCRLANVPDGGSCDDGTSCDGTKTCDGGACVPGAAPSCDDGNVCTTDECVPCSTATCGPDECRHTPIPGCCRGSADDCEGTTPCGRYLCEDNVCVPPAADCCQIAADCDDGNPCTDDTCVASHCTHAAVDGAQRGGCGDACTPATTCVAGTCVTGGMGCDDGDPCTEDACDAETGACTHVRCPDDGDICTNDVCVPTGADTPVCTHPRIDGCVACNGPGENDLTCGPRGRCGGDACSEGRCVRVPTCDDGNLDTDDRCTLGPNLEAVCAFPCTAASCDDGNACNGREDRDPATCACRPGSPPVCGDDDACNGEERCDPRAGCTSGTPKVGLDAVSCQLARFERVIGAASTTDLGAALRKRLGRDVGRLKAKLAAAASQPAGKKRQRSLSAASKLTTGLDRAIAAARRKTKKPQVTPGVADELQAGLRRVGAAIAGAGTSG